MTFVDDHQDPLITELLAAEAEAMSVAQQHMFFYSPFSQLPNEVAFRTLSDYTRLLLGRGIAKHEVPRLLETDLAAASARLRGSLASMPWVNSVQRAVLLHVAMFIGIEQTQKIPDLWEALRKKDFTRASEAILMSNWPSVVGQDQEGRRRVIDLVRMMREGTLSLDWTRSTY